MASAKDKKKAAETEKKKREEKARGTNDDFEILKLIVNENKGLYLRVLDKIRHLRGHTKESIFDVASKKQKQKFSNSRTRRDDAS
jgi:hypothetical protein